MLSIGGSTLISSFEMLFILLCWLVLKKASFLVGGAFKWPSYWWATDEGRSAYKWQASYAAITYFGQIG